MPDELYTQFDSVFFERTRLSILTLIHQWEKVSFNQLKNRLGGTDGAIYTHLEKLLQRGYIRKKKELTGTSAQTVYSITHKGSMAFEDYLEFLEKVLKDAKGENL